MREGAAGVQHMAATWQPMAATHTTHLLWPLPSCGLRCHRCCV